MTASAWSVRQRQPNLRLGEDCPVKQLVLYENYGLPDQLVVDARLQDVPALLAESTGVCVTDGDGLQRFTGIPDPTGITRKGDGTCSISYVADSVWLWGRICYPTPANDWTYDGQSSTAYDTQSGPIEDRICGFVNRNLGPTSRTERRLPYLRSATSAGRGSTARTASRFDTLGVLVSTLAESASLRVRIVQKFDADGTPYLWLQIDACPDMSAVARFGDVTYGGPAILDPSWSYRTGRPAATTLLAAAAGEGIDRELGQLTDSDGAAVWGRIEQFVDMRGTGSWPDAKKAVVQAQGDQLKAQIALADANKRRAVALHVYNMAAADAADAPSNTARQQMKSDAQSDLDDATSTATQANADLATATAALSSALNARDQALSQDTLDIQQQLADAMLQAVGPVEVSAPIGPSDLGLGTDIPVGSMCAINLDGNLIPDRLRQVRSTVIGVGGNDARLRVTGVVGSPDAGLKDPTQKQLRAMLARLAALERSL